MQRAAKLLTVSGSDELGYVLFSPFLSRGNSTEVQQVLTTILTQLMCSTSPKRGRCVKGSSRSNKRERHWMHCSRDAHHRWHGNTGAEGVTLPAAPLCETQLRVSTCGCVWKERSALADRRWQREGCWPRLIRASAPSCGRTRIQTAVHPTYTLLVHILTFLLSQRKSNPKEAQVFPCL